jgi:hypothetical protein
LRLHPQIIHLEDGYPALSNGNRNDAYFLFYISLASGISARGIFQRRDRITPMMAIDMPEDSVSQNWPIRERA